jgi:hypothetical protein
MALFDEIVSKAILGWVLKSMRVDNKPTKARILPNNHCNKKDLKNRHEQHIHYINKDAPPMA